MKYIVANWKMHKTRDESVDFIDRLTTGLQNQAAIEFLPIIAGSFTLLQTLSDAAADSCIQIAAQNIATAESGALTGEISARQLADVGCRYVLIGHSERRQLFYETDEIIAEKIQCAIKHSITPILCVGETAVERADGATRLVIERQLESGLRGTVYTIGETGSALGHDLIIAYEPVWAIGGEAPPETEEIASIHQSIKQIIGQDVPVLYGGSVNPENAPEILNTANVDGLLVGRSSLVVTDFLQICTSS